MSAGAGAARPVIVHRVTWRALTVTLTMLVVGALAGWALAQRSGEVGYATEPPAPLPASPSAYPGHVQVQPDPAFPTLAVGLPLRERALGPRGHGVTVRVPEGWAFSQPDGSTWQFRPPGYVDNSYLLRVRLVDNLHLTVPQARAQRFHNLSTVVADLAREDDAEDGFVASYLTDGGHRRLTMERFFAVHGSGSADVTVAVVGRMRDRAGMADLLARVSASLQPR